MNLKMDRNGSMCTTPVTTRRKTTRTSGPTTCISVIQGCSRTFETIRRSHCNRVQAWVGIAAALLVILVSHPIPVSAYSTTENAHALIEPPNISKESEHLAISFLNATLPKLLANDNRLAQRLGFGGNASELTVIDKA